MTADLLDEQLSAGVREIVGRPSATGDWSGVLRAAASEPRRRRREAPRSFERVSLRGALVAVAAVAVVSLGAVYGPYDWITSQSRTFDPSPGVDMAGAAVVAHLGQHDGGILEIAEKIVPAHVDPVPLRSSPALRCVVTRPAPPADPVAARVDPLSFGGDAQCSHLETMSFESNVLDDGSASVLARRPDGAERIEVRAGSSSWQPSSSDGSWVVFDLPPGSLASGVPADVVALDRAGRVLETQRILPVSDSADAPAPQPR
jgi:hypothetical protein